VKNWLSNPYYNALEKIEFADGTSWDQNAMKAIVPTAYVGSAAAESLQGWDGIDIVDGGAGNDTLNGLGGNDQLAGGDGDDIINAGEGNDRVAGGAGNDVIDGGAGADLIDGGEGNDRITDYGGANILRGGAGSDIISGNGTFEGGSGDDALSAADYGTADTYVFNLGDGNDTVSDTSYGDRLDVLRFGAGISKEMISFDRSGNDMVIRVGTSDSITVKNWLSNPYYNALERIEFADGSSWDQTAMKAIVPVAYAGTAAAESLQGWDGIDIIDGGAGNDTLNGLGGNDQLAGGEGDDVVNGGDGDDQIGGGAGADVIDGGNGADVIDGGEGNDRITDYGGANLLRGGAGSDAITGRGTFEGGGGDDTLVAGDYASADTYLFKLGDGQDTISDTSYGDRVDTLRFGAGITREMVGFVRSGSDMLIRVAGGDQITVKNWLANSYYNALERIEFADGSAMTQADVLAMAQPTQAAAAVARPATAQMVDQALSAFDGGGTAGMGRVSASALPASVTAWAISEALLDFQFTVRGTTELGMDLTDGAGGWRSVGALGLGAVSASESVGASGTTWPQEVGRTHGFKVALAA
jgi:Ca2+-binding RTX toxin-like protein